MIIRTGKPLSAALLSRDLAWKQRVESSDSAATDLLVQRGVGATRCTVCDGEGVECIVVRSIPYLECRDCRHLFIGIVPDDSLLEALYETGDSAQDIVYIDPDAALRADRVAQIAQPKFEFIDTSLGNSPDSPRGLWIDIGSGVGDLLQCARESGWQALGIEADVRQASIAQGRGIHTQVLLLDRTINPPTAVGRASVISLINVVEHFPDPVATVGVLARAMQSGSHLAIEVPRHPSISVILNGAGIGPVYRHANPPEHLNIFSSCSMQLMMERLGFSIIAEWSFGSDALQVFTDVGAVLEHTSGFLDQQSEIAIEKLQAQVDAAGLSDTMLVVAKKN